MTATNFNNWPKKAINFHAAFLEMTSFVTNRACLGGMGCYHSNFRQFNPDDTAVGIDLVFVKHGFVIRDFKSAVTNQGNGDVAMSCLTELADIHNIRFDLTAQPDYRFENDVLKPLIPEEKLIRFYESHLFFRVPSKTDIAPNMFRVPQRK
jgi:hypothetical protein